MVTLTLTVVELSLVQTALHDLQQKLIAREYQEIDTVLELAQLGMTESGYTDEKAYEQILQSVNPLHDRVLAQLQSANK